MTRTKAVPIFGLLFIVSTALGLGTIVALSPYTHHNLATEVRQVYDRTPLDTVGEADLQAIQAELAKLPPSVYAVSNARHLSEVAVGPAPESIRVAVGSPAVTGASQVPAASVGRELFMQKCTSCHSVGGGRRVGPDLNGITAQKPRDWLIAFVTAPDEMLARGDPLAAQLVKAYGVPMPNLGLSPVQSEAILAYLDAESGALTPAPAQPAAGAPAAGQDAAVGKALYEQRCTSCHTIGGGKLVGPDLKGVATRRPRDWVIDFIATPDKVIASGDPIAAELLQEYRIPMPNLGVSRDQAAQITSYLETQR